MPDTPPSPWDIVFKRMDRLETKIDLLGERVVARDEFERHKAEEREAREQIQAALTEHKRTLDAREREDRKRSEDETSKWRIFWAGIVLTPLVSMGISLLIMRGSA